MTLIDLDPGRHRAPDPDADPVHLLSCRRHVTLPLCGADAAGQPAVFATADATCVGCLWRHKEGLVCARWRCSGRASLWRSDQLGNLLVCLALLAVLLVWRWWR